MTQAPEHPALEQLRQALASVDGANLDPMTTPWAELEPAIARLLGGSFDPDREEHRVIAMLVAATFGERVKRDLAGFWFPNRASLDGAAMGFPGAVIMFSPLEVALQALRRARLQILDDVGRDLGQTVARATAESGQANAFGPDDYRRMFDPGFLQLACVDLAKVRGALAHTGNDAANELEEAMGRLPSAMPGEVRASLRDQIVGTLRRLPDGPLGARTPEAAPLVELIAFLSGATEVTRFAPAEMWEHLLLPLLHIGAAEVFPPLEDEDREALRAGTDPLVIYVETVPFKTPALDEDGILGVFPPEGLGALAPELAGLPTSRIAVAPVAPLAGVAASFDRAAVAAAVARFTRHAVEQAQGVGAAAPNVESKLLPIALELLGELVRVVAAAADATAGERAIVLRRAPEAEAQSDATLQELRRALHGSRIILI
ncbi:MAG TPA: hypothetical protein VHJ20_16685 [Polyangia bacterium]|nr:hypothetical protein [Polyangia bacterium]